VWGERFKKKGNFLWNWKRGGHTETLLIFVFGCNADELLDLEI